MYDRDINKKGSRQMRKNQMEIRIKDLDKYYGRKHALKHLTLTIPSGMFGLLGRNGAGKTTLMKVLATLLKKKAKRGGHDLWDSSRGSSEGSQDHRIPPAGFFHVSKYGGV